MTNDITVTSYGTTIELYTDRTDMVANVHLPDLENVTDIIPIINQLIRTVVLLPHDEHLRTQAEYLADANPSAIAAYDNVGITRNIQRGKHIVSIFLNADGTYVIDIDTLLEKVDEKPNTVVSIKHHHLMNAREFHVLQNAWQNGSFAFENCPQYVYRLKEVD